MKKLFFAAVLTVASAIGGYHYHNANKSQNLSEIAKANIEALADWVMVGDCGPSCADFENGDKCCTVFAGAGVIIYLYYPGTNN